MCGIQMCFVILQAPSEKVGVIAQMTDIINFGNRVVNTYLLRSNYKTILVDTGYSEQFDAFHKRLRKHGLSLHEIDYIFLTHAHDDHAGFLADVLYSSNAEVIMHENGINALFRGQNCFDGGCSSRTALVFCKLMKHFGKDEHRFPPFPEELKNRLLLVRPDTRITLESVLGAHIVETPGHTSCSISLLTDDGMLFCGDAAMNGFPSSERVTIWIENMGDFCKSWEKIIKLNPQAIYPGHGKPFPVSNLELYLNDTCKRTLYPLIRNVGQ